MAMPDVAGEIIAWRAWRTVRLGRNKVALSSVTAGTLWPSDRYMVAECPDDHDVPDEACRCGIYAARDRDQLFDLAYGHYSDPDDVHVIGEVALSGKVIVGTQGWRAQRARVYKLCVPYSAWKLARALEHYNAPLQLTNPFPK